MKSHLSLFGIPVTIRPTALGAGIVSVLVVSRISREHRAALSAAAGVLWYTADCTHVIGHIISSQAVGAPINAVDFGIFPKSVYLSHNVSPQQHIGRACGGVIASLIAALVLAVLARSMTNPIARRLVTIAAAQHGMLFAVSMLPIPIVDGGVIYGNLAAMMRD